MSSFSKSRRFQMERLEDRQMMAGDLTATMVNGTLFINEAAGSLGLDQAVNVSQRSNGDIVVKGLANASGGRTLINNQESVVFTHPLNLVIGTGGGNDVIGVVGYTGQHIQILAESPNGSGPDNDSVSLGSVRTSGQVDIRTGAGKDIVSVVGCVIGDGTTVNNVPDDLKISMGVAAATGDADADQLLIQSTTTRAATDISTGASNDVVTIRDSTLGNDRSDFLRIKTGAGADLVEMMSHPNNPQQNFQSIGGNMLLVMHDSVLENDVDTVKAKQLIFESASIQLGGGNDVVDMLSLFGTGDLVLDGHGGNDNVKLANVEGLQNFFALMGEGDDTLDITYIKAQQMTLDGGGNFDRLERHQMPSIPSLTVKGWEVINGVPQMQKKTIPSTFPRAVATFR